MNKKNDENYDRTFHSIEKWHKKMFEKFGWMLLSTCKSKLKCYLDGLSNLKNCIEYKIHNTHSGDKKQDLQILWKNVNVLIDRSRMLRK
jgi:hypothetical protein